MKLTLFLSILFFTIQSCTSQSEKILPVINVESGDSAMNNAILKANQTLNQFNSALKDDKNKYDAFSLKVRFDTKNGGGEHIWISDIQLIDSNYFGIVDNYPETTEEVKFGEKIKINMKNISDWKYMQGRKLYGGYTIKVLRDAMTKEEQIQFDKDTDGLFKD